MFVCYYEQSESTNIKDALCNVFALCNHKPSKLANEWKTSKIFWDQRIMKNKKLYLLDQVKPKAQYTITTCCNNKLVLTVYGTICTMGLYNTLVRLVIFLFSDTV